ncbi:MAG: hypothetical protein QW560_06115 [Candidatus Nitrosocaldus sp.]
MEKEEEEIRLASLEVVMKQFNKANSIFSEAIVTKVVDKRKELLEQALIAYVEILPLLPNWSAWDIRLIRRTVLDKIHAVEQWIEQEIERSVISSSSCSSNSNNTTSKIEEALAEARVRLAID